MTLGVRSRTDKANNNRLRVAGCRLRVDDDFISFYFFCGIVFDKYADEGIRTIENAKVLKLKPFSDMGTPMEIINQVFGGKTSYENALQELEQELFKQELSA